MTLDPAELVGEAELHGGKRVLLRPLGAADEPMLQDLLDHMSQEDRRCAFSRRSGGCPNGWCDA